MSVRELCRDDLLGRFADHTFTEVVVGDTTRVEFRDGADALIIQSTKLDVDDAYMNIRSNLVKDPNALFILTSAQRIALTGTENGTQIIDSTAGRLSMYVGNSWVSATVV